MRFILYIAITLSIFGCVGTNFYLNQEPAYHVVTIAQGERTLELKGEALIKDNVFRGRFISEFFRGNAEIIFENGNFTIDYESLPIDEEKIKYLKNDLYAAYYAGDYPYKADNKMFGDAIRENDTKLVKAADGYTLYKVTYNLNEIRVHNLVNEYFIIIQSDRKLK